MEAEKEMALFYCCLKSMQCSGNVAYVKGFLDMFDFLSFETYFVA